MDRVSLKRCSVLGRGVLPGVAEALLLPLLFALAGLLLAASQQGAVAPEVAVYPAEMVPEREGEPGLWLVDGFNVVSVGLLRDAGGEKERDGWWRREHREALLERVRRFDDPEAEVWVVFDGGDASGDRHQGATHTIFAPSADDWLLERVRRAEVPEALTVVTADRRLANRVRARGARVVSPGDFLGRCLA